MSTTLLTFQEAILRLQRFWHEEGCLLLQPMNTEVGAGTMNPWTFLHVLGPKPWSVAYVEPSVRPDDSRYGENPNRMQTHTQFQVILKPDTGEPVEQYLRSLAAIGIDIDANDIRLVEDNWESPALGAWGLGWEIWLNGLEITQFTYFQQAGGMTLDPVSVEITYGLERILMALQRRSHFTGIEYASGVPYGDLFARSEAEMSAYYLDVADIGRTRKRFEMHEAEADAMLAHSLVLPAYRQVLAMSHLFNVLDARGAVGLAERAGFFARMRTLSRGCAELWLEAEASTVVSASDDVLRAISIDEKETGQSYAANARSAAFVLEIGVEEMPPHDIETAVIALEEALPRLLGQARIPHGPIDVLTTPRRLIVTIQDVSVRQEDLREALRGPRAEVAWDEAGAPTKAASGFARKHGLTPDQLERHEGFVVAIVERTGRATVEVLAEEMPAVISAIKFRRSMRWNASGATFSRPVRWLVALHGPRVVQFSFAGVASGRTTRRLRGDDTARIELETADDYMPILERLGVILNRGDRRDAIWQHVTQLARDIQGTAPKEYRGALLEEVTDLVEAPTAILATFDRRFLSLPPEVLRIVMVKHQRFFPLVRGDQVLHSFVAVANGPVDEDVVRRGNEAVIQARYRDAEFFYEKDLQRAFEDYRQDLRTLTFHENLGSFLGKTDRLEPLTSWLSDRLGVDDATTLVAQRAASLAKNDLVTQMVTEFSGLAGVMGRYYALRSGEPNDVADAIREHLRPVDASDDPPIGLAGALVGVADRLDTLVGLFGVGIRPRSAADPYALRRCAYGLILTLIQHDLDLDLVAAIDRAATGYTVEISPEARKDAIDFVARRFEIWLLDSGLAHDVVQSACESSRSLVVKHRIAQELAGLVGDDTFMQAHNAYTRAERLGRNAKPGAHVDETLFETAQERALWATYMEIRPAALAATSLEAFVHVFTDLVEPIDELFGQVYVMSEDSRVATNRLALLRSIADLPLGLANLAGLGSSLQACASAQPDS